MAGVLATSGSSSTKTTGLVDDLRERHCERRGEFQRRPSAAGQLPGLRHRREERHRRCPTFGATAAERRTRSTLTTNRGDIVFTADGKAAPYTVDSFVYLAEKGYYNNTKCHRLVWSSRLYMLQCGDPTGTGGGGPGYAFPDENLASLGTGNPAR